MAEGDADVAFEEAASFAAFGCSCGFAGYRVECRCQALRERERESEEARRGRGQDKKSKRNRTRRVGEEKGRLGGEKRCEYLHRRGRQGRQSSSTRVSSRFSSQTAALAPGTRSAARHGGSVVAACRDWAQWRKGLRFGICHCSGLRVSLFHLSRPCSWSCGSCCCWRNKNCVAADGAGARVGADPHTDRQSNLGLFHFRSFTCFGPCPCWCLTLGFVFHAEALLLAMLACSLACCYVAMPVASRVLSTHPSHETALFLPVIGHHPSCVACLGSNSNYIPSCDHALSDIHHLHSTSIASPAACPPRLSFLTNSTNSSITPGQAESSLQKLSSSSASVFSAKTRV